MTSWTTSCTKCHMFSSLWENVCRAPQAFREVTGAHALKVRRSADISGAIQTLYSNPVCRCDNTGNVNSAAGLH